METRKLIIRKTRQRGADHYIWRRAMSKDRALQDIISQSEYTMRMKAASSQPQDDSPGDSELDSGAEFNMGVEYMPRDEFDPPKPLEEPMMQDLQKTKTNQAKIITHPYVEVSDSVRVVDSGLPTPWADSESDSATH